jgi:CcmD family protein
MKRINFLLLAALLCCAVPAQASGFDTSMHASGKINVVIGVILLIFVGLILYLFLTDRKLSRIEKELKDRES